MLAPTDITHPPGSGQTHNALLTWAGWTVLLAALVYGALTLAPSTGIWGVFAAALIVGAASRRWSLAIAPLLLGLVGFGLIVYEAGRDTESQFALDAGYQWAALAVAVMAGGAMVSVVIGVAIGKVAAAFLAPTPPDPASLQDRARPSRLPGPESGPSTANRQLLEDILSSPLPRDPGARPPL